MATILDSGAMMQGHPATQPHAHHGARVHQSMDMSGVQLLRASEFVDDMESFPSPPCLTGQCMLAVILGYMLTRAVVSVGAGEPSNGMALDWLPIMTATVGISLGVSCFASLSRVCHPITVFPVIAAASFTGVLLYRVFLAAVGGGGSGYFSTCVFGALFSTIVISVSKHRAWWRLICFESYAQGAMFQARAHGMWRNNFNEMLLHTGMFKRRGQGGGHGHSHGGRQCDSCEHSHA